MHIFRADRTNAGDWWSPPLRYFPFRNSGVLDILGLQSVPAPAGSCVIVGGGGLGRETFHEALRVIQDPTRDYRLVAWGVGADVAEDREGSVPEDHADLLGDRFEGFDLVGTRIWKPGGRHEWVPCASCLHPSLAAFRERAPTDFIGVYEHKRVPIAIHDADGARLPTMDNDGDSIEQKLEFLSRFEYVISNSYHGVYWATLLNRKVLCLPFKNGLYSFRHRPVYLHDRLEKSHLAQAVAYPDALDECRLANLKFHARVIERFGDV